MYAIRSYYALVSSVTVLSHVAARPLPGFIVRKEAKGHGTGRYLEGLGNFKPGMKVAMLEDVVTTGGTLRITSYNVCYTKLLRGHFPGRLGPQGAGPLRERDAGPHGPAREVLV